MNEIEIVRDISRKFEQATIPFMLTGSMAMNYYAQPRMTRDIDVVVAISPNDVEPHRGAVSTRLLSERRILDPSFNLVM
jgi:hypothetical protein